jgi:hypothetical protein
MWISTTHWAQNRPFFQCDLKDCKSPGIIHKIIQAFVVPKRQIAFENHSIKTGQGRYNAGGELLKEPGCEFHGVLLGMAV